MNEKEQLQHFLTVYMHLRQQQNEYFKFRSNTVLKGCKLLEHNLDALAQRLMIDLDMDLSLLPEQPKLF